jgi:hypothetical protein
MLRGITRTAVVTTFGVLFAMLLASIAIDRSIADEELRRTATFALLLVTAVVWLVLSYVFVPRWEERRNQPRHFNHVPTKRRRWWVVASCSLILGSFWFLISYGVVVDDPASESLMMFSSPFLTAIVASIGLCALGPLRAPGEFRLLSNGRLPLAMMLLIAAIGILFMPLMAILIFQGPSSLAESAGEVHYGFLLYPAICAVGRLLLV